MKRVFVSLIIVLMLVSPIYAGTRQMKPGKYIKEKIVQRYITGPKYDGQLPLGRQSKIGKLLRKFISGKIFRK